MTSMPRDVCVRGLSASGVRASRGTTSTATEPSVTTARRGFSGGGASSCVAIGGSLPHRPSRRKSWPRRRPCSSHYQGDHAPAGAIGRCGECAGENGALSRRSSAPGSRLPHQAREELERASRGLREPPKAHHPSVTGTAVDDQEGNDVVPSHRMDERGEHGVAEIIQHLRALSLDRRE